MMKNRIRSVLAMMAIGVAGTSCGSSGGTQGTSSGQVEFYSWWVSGGELQALQAMLHVFKMNNPDIDVINATGSSSTAAQARLQMLMTAGTPPDTFQSNGGANLLQWVVIDGTDANSVMEPLESYSASEGWNFAPEMTKYLTYKSHLYAVPVDLQRENALFYNVKLFTDNGINPPTGNMSWTDFYAMCDKLLAKGITPLAIGLGGGSWTWQLTAFEGIFAGMTGATNYTKYFTGQGNWDDPDMVSALQVSATLVTKYSDVNVGDKGALKRQWSDACGEVESGKAAMTIMGDWAKGYFTSNGWKPGTDFNQVMVPSAQPLFVFSTDVFGLPKGAPDPANALALVESFASIRSQEAFAPIKGCLPARIDADVSSPIFDALAVASFADFKSLPKAAAGSILLPNAFQTPVDNQLLTIATDGTTSGFIVDGDVTAMLNVIHQNYTYLSPAASQ
jgi:glucose/mannose transport system substrate-binding protein